MHVRRTLLVALATLLIPLPGALAGPLDPPPPDRLRTWLVEFTGSKPTITRSTVHVASYGPGPVLIEVIGFQLRGRRRDLFSGNTTYFAAMPGEGNYNYPVVYAEGHGTLTPPCTYMALCYQTEPLPYDDVFPLFGPPQPVQLSFYVVALNADITQITSSPGWRAPREISNKGFAVHLAGYTGTGVYSHGMGVEKFSHAQAPGGRYGSIAIATIPCDLPAPIVDSVQRCRATLAGGDPPPVWNDGQYVTDGKMPAVGAASGATTWTLDGNGTGWSPSPYRLAVVDLPAVR